MMTKPVRGRKPKYPEWQAVCILPSIQEAHIIAGRLQAEGIETMIQGEAGASALGFTIGNWGEVRVLVSPEDYSDAMDLLFPEGDEELDDSEWDEDFDE